PRLRPLRPAVLAVAALFACGPEITGVDPIEELPRALSTDEQALVRAGNRFAVDLLRQVHAAAPDSTVFLSPLSASMALGMTTTGAAGATLDQMRATLGFGALPVAAIGASYRDLIELLRGL